MTDDAIEKILKGNRHLRLDDPVVSTVYHTLRRLHDTQLKGVVCNFIDRRKSCIAHLQTLPWKRWRTCGHLITVANTAGGAWRGR